MDPSAPGQGSYRPIRQYGRCGLIFNIQKFSLHGGAGIRTIVFLKGCPLACAWCSNPESQDFAPELAYTRDRCIGTDECDRCMGTCPLGAIRRGEDGKIDVERVRCDNCGACVDACPSKALEMCGELVSVDDVIRTVEEDGAFYVRSGGGLTISGGEPLAQPEFVKNLLVAARTHGLDTAIETSGLCAWRTFAEVAACVDEVRYDIKCIDAKKHKRTTGVSNERILGNFRRLRQRFPSLPVTVRTPVIPGVNDSERDIRAIVDFIDSAGGASAYELLPYHRFGESKYHKLGRKCPLGDVEAPSDARMNVLRRIAH
jgi:pyruvate formate lyase activating enzyme